MKIKILSGGIMPTRAHETDAGLDLKSPISVCVQAHDSKTIDTKVCVQLPEGTVGMLKSKSGLNVNHCITSEGVIDVGYTGSIKVKLYNHSDDDYFFTRGDKISQLVVIPCLFPELEVVGELEESDRGSHGFGSTGR